MATSRLTADGVDVDIASQAFTGKDTINVGAYIVGGFPEYNGSYIIPQLEWGAKSNDADTYNPNWTGFLDNAFAVASGASSSARTGRSASRTGSSPRLALSPSAR